MARRIRILYLIGSLEVGGAEGHLAQLVRHLDPDRYQVEVGCLSRMGPLADEISRAGIPVHLFGLRGLGRSPLRLFAAAWRGIGGHIRRFQPQIVHTYLYHANLAGGLMARLAGAPVLVTSRRSLGLFKDGRPYLQWAENLMNTRTDAVTVNSRQVEADVLQREAWVNRKLRLIYNGVDAERFAAPARSPAAVRAEIGLPPEARVVGCIANLIPYKGHADLLTAMAAVVEAVPDAHLVLVGKDHRIQDRLVDQARGLGLEQRIHFLGSRLDVTDLLHAFDLATLASHEEGFSNVILEAMAAGLPVVATAVGGNPEAVVDGETGLLVPPRNPAALGRALVKLLVDPEGAAAMGRRGQERVRREFSIPAMVSGIETLYADLLARKGLGGLV